MNLKFEIIESTTSRLKFIKSWEIAFKRSLGDNFYNWIFSDDNKIFAALDNDNVVAGYCLLGIDAFINGEKLHGALCNNVFVCGLKYSKMGVFDLLTKFSLFHESNNFEFGIGFPNQKAIRSHLRCSWEIPTSVELLELNSFNANYVKNGHVSTSIINDTTISLLMECSNMPAYNNSSFFIDKNKKFLNWRYVSNPRYSYHLTIERNSSTVLAYVITKYFEDRRRIHILDYGTRNGHPITTVLDDAFKHYTDLSLDVDCMDLWASKSEQNIFLNSGFNISGQSQPVIFNNLKSSLSSDCLMTSPHLVLSDNDVY